MHTRRPLLAIWLVLIIFASPGALAQVILERAPSLDNCKERFDDPTEVEGTAATTTLERNQAISIPGSSACKYAIRITNTGGPDHKAHVNICAIPKSGAPVELTLHVSNSISLFGTRIVGVATDDDHDHNSDGAKVDWRIDKIDCS